MSHLKYTTPAFLVFQAQSGEADKFLYLYTKDFGMVHAIGKSVRVLQSKLKSSLEEGNFLSASLVRGRDIWRLTDTTIEEKLPFPGKEFNLFLKILRLLKSMVAGEEKNEKLFLVLQETFEFLRQSKTPEKMLPALECVAVVRILDALGYGREEVDWGISTTETITETLLKTAEKNKKTIISLINKSLKESHL